MKEEGRNVNEEKPEREETGQDNGLLDVFRFEQVGDPALQAMTESLEDVDILELVRDCKDIIRGLRARR